MIRNIIAVYRIQCSDIDRAISDPNFDFGDKLNSISPATLFINSKVVDKNYLWEYKLVFRICHDLEVHGHWAYVLKQADGRWMILGTINRPYTVTISSKELPDNLSDNQLWQVTVTWNNKSQVTYID